MELKFYSKSRECGREVWGGSLLAYGFIRVNLYNFTINRSTPPISTWSSRGGRRRARSRSKVAGSKLGRKLSKQLKLTRLIGADIVIHLFGGDVADINPVVNRASPSCRKLHRLGGRAT